MKPGGRTGGVRGPRVLLQVLVLVIGGQDEETKGTEIGVVVVPVDPCLEVGPGLDAEVTGGLDPGLGLTVGEDPGPTGSLGLEDLDLETGDIVLHL